MSAMSGNRLSLEWAGRFVELAMGGLEREFPYKPGMVLEGMEDLRRPREVTPVFYGHFDWHSSVHGHWTLVRLLRLFPEAEWAGEVRRVLGRKLTAEGLAKEAEYLRKNGSFERMYGWAWALRLGLELRVMEDEEGRAWAGFFRPVETAIVENAKGYLPKLDWPVRCGFHPESAFPMSQMWDWARGAGDVELTALVEKKGRDFYGKDRDYPVRYEPSGNDFFSPGLNEADLMRRVLGGDEFKGWLRVFFRGLEFGNLEDPVAVRDFEDGHLVHLVGLNLSRAWVFRGLAGEFEEGERERFLEWARIHEEAGLRDVFSGHYEGDHWLGSFAVYLLSGVGEGVER